jgi:hypothetical protein
MDGVPYEFSRTSKTQLFPNIKAVGFNRFGAKPQVLSRFLVGLAHAKKAKDFKFPVAEATQRIIGNHSAARFFEQLSGRLDTERHSPAKDGPQ